MFNSKCLRTQNRWQQHLLAQQRALLGVVTGRLKAAERSLRQDEEAQDTLGGLFVWRIMTSQSSSKEGYRNYSIL